ncbi:MAG: SDR family NAD(P)-dependent oxidoreductase [Acidimicrobiales bacterium]
MNTATAKTVVVTGASKGLGAAISARLASEGFTVFAAARQPAETTHPNMIPVALDVTDRRSLAAAADTVARAVGGLGVFALVNNAAVLEAGPLELADAAQIDRHLRTNVGGPLAATQAFLPLLRAAGGRIVNVSSINAQLPLPFWGLYSASKAALVALSDALRCELAPQGIGVSVLTLGAFATDIRRRALTAWPESGPYAAARAASEALVAALDGTAADPTLVSDVVFDVLSCPQAPAHRVVGEGVEDLLALASQPPEVRDAALSQLLAAPVN